MVLWYTKVFLSSFSSEIRKQLLKITFDEDTKLEYGRNAGSVCECNSTLLVFQEI